jgi:hypothetical protein
MPEILSGLRTSLALSMILYGLLVKSEALGSTDGFNILPSTLFGIRPGAEWVRYAVLVSAAAVALVAALLVHRYLETPLGRLAPAIKDNEIRVEYMGASARRAVQQPIAGGPPRPARRHDRSQAYRIPKCLLTTWRIIFIAISPARAT